METEAMRLAEGSSFERPEPCAIVLFGASGDLAQRMVVPAIFRLFTRGLVHPDFRLIGYARTAMTDDEFRSKMRDAIMAHAEPGDAEAWERFASRLSYISSEDEDDGPEYAQLEYRLGVCDRESGSNGRRLFYLALPPAAFAPTIRRLSDRGLAGKGYTPPSGAWARVIVEKPFGRDLESARALNREIASILDERDIYRIDHFLGKEAVQNLFAFRFANGLFEPVWNRNFVDHVEITAAETLGMEGTRGSYYDTAGALRDMVQNHLMQMLALVTLEPPSEWTPDAVRDEKVKVLRAVRPIRPEDVPHAAVRGQYGAGAIEGESVPGYREEKKVAPDSNVETYAALELHIDNWRWAGVPFYLRTGKRLSKRLTQIVVEFKAAPHSPFSERGHVVPVTPNRLIVQVGPEEGLILQVQGKQPGHGMRLRPVELDYLYSQDKGKVESPTAYENLLLDAMRGKTTLFSRADEVEVAWEIVQPILDSWGAEPATEFPNYAAGSTGPADAEDIVRRSGREWLCL
jgi:glucose-6-phosphate 1-dehydrogenase